YKAAHVHFTSGLNDDLFNDLNRRLKANGAAEYILSLKELYVDFMVNETAVFTVDPSTSFRSVFGDDRMTNPDEALSSIAKQVTSIVQKEIDNFCRLNQNFPPPRNPPQPRATLLILDRSIDPAAPLLHEFTYQAMINDLLHVEDTDNHVGVKYSYQFHQADGSVGVQDVILDEEDHVYKSIRHMHIAECSDRLIENFNEFLAENKTAVSTSDRNAGPKDSAKSLKEMKEMLTNLPQYQDLKAKYSAHLSIAQECMSYFERHNLSSVGTLEQNMATGETVEGEIPKTIVLDMVPLLDAPHVSPIDKARLLMLYIIWKEGGIFEDDKRKLLEHAKLDAELCNAINNLPLMGVKLTRIRRSEKGYTSASAMSSATSLFRKRRQRKNKEDEQETPYELSRYTPIIKKVMDAHFSNTLDPQQFAFTRQSDVDSAKDGHGHAPGDGGIPASGVSLRTTKPTWAKKNNTGSGVTTPIRQHHGAKLIVFVIGGATYSEIRSAYEISDTYNRDVYLGTTEVLRPQNFVRHLSQLTLPIPQLPPVIAPY
ncbi:Sec1-like protein, partial [Mycotypha africana]|uniref:Sec1-like protein n=1 Tax=Mycotypha africana TaxID=64632 RepID=UPI0023000E88